MNNYILLILLCLTRGIQVRNDHSSQVWYSQSQSDSTSDAVPNHQYFSNLSSQHLEVGEKMEGEPVEHTQNQQDSSPQLWQIILIIIVGCSIIGVIVFFICKKCKERGYFEAEKEKLEENQVKKKLMTKQSRKCIIVGMVGAGKSSLLNLLFSLHQPTGMGGCTNKTARISVADSETKNQIYDSIGLLSTSAFRDKHEDQLYKFALDYDRIFLLFEDSLKPAEKFVRFVVSSEKEVIFVRTKCDRFGEGQFRTVEQEIQVDRELLRKWGVRNIKLYATSANSKMKTAGNEEVKKLLTT